MKKLEPRILFRNLFVELIIYSVLVVGYYLLVLRWIDDWLLGMFNNNLVLYAFVGLGLILLQGAVTDLVTTLLLRYVKLDQFGLRRVLDVFSDR